MTSNPKAALYERAVIIAMNRPTLSAGNLKTALGCTEAVAKSFITVMIRERIIGQATGPLGRHACLKYQSPDGTVHETHVNLDEPEASTIADDAGPDDVLSQEAQKRLKIITDYIVAQENDKAVINEGISAAYANAKQLGIAPKALKVVVKIIRNAAQKEFREQVDQVELYLHALGELVEDAPAEAAS